ncbi:MAG: tRNA uridine-5-carboxymethylaminomethyl(34) synthesis enzyme MnmG [Bdellovibrionales bacterium]|nr:tRNA uridine-5-carboxymethylaminomethyl(34) synthesis enzyme MnmG [Bdellovibrionales bacterium]
MNADFDVIVVGAGHAGIEAAAAGHRLGLRVAVVTSNVDRIGYMSCNPSIGGLGKGHIVKEVDALGGEMGRAADETCIQFKRLNARKGPAVRGSRAQCDKFLYSDYMGRFLRGLENIRILEGEAVRLLLEGSFCRGVVLADGSQVWSRAVVLTTGTFLSAVMHFGLRKVAGGRIGDSASEGLSDQLRDRGFNILRLKTGTPARLRKGSINWSALVAQSGDERFVPFSVRSENVLKLPQIQCHLSYTNERTHEVIRRNLHLSPMYCGVIEGIGPRYCPSIEDKITRFADKDRHQTFLEPEGLNSDLIYLQGMSTSLPEEVQYEFLRTIPGLESVEILQPGYAVEYDCVEPSQIRHSLETREIEGLFLAGQINGTSGYEEAAGQGLVAGANAGLKILGKDELILGRDESYIGVMIDDLVTKGTREPYRMMTARAGYRLHLREDNVLERLSDRGIGAGLVDGVGRERVEHLLKSRRHLEELLEAGRFVPDEETQRALLGIGTAVLGKPMSYADLLRRPELSCFDLMRLGVPINEDERVWEPVEIGVKYSGYISRQREVIFQAQKMERVLLPDELRYNEVSGLSSEEVEKLSRIRPRTLGQAGRISGVNPSAIQALVVYLKAAERRRGPIYFESRG